MDTASVPNGLRDWVQAQVEKGSFELPLLPEVATRVMELTARVDSDAAELSEILHRDQSLAGHILRVANSPSLGSSVTIVSLQQAVSRLGMTKVAEIAVAISVGGKLFQPSSHADLTANLWRHALATGNYAKEVARTRRENVETAFLCGLLHSVGKPLLLGLIGEYETSKRVVLEDSVVLAFLDDAHIEFGHILCREWELPPQVTEAVRYHVDYEQTPNHSVMAMMTHLAMWLAYHTLGANEVSEDLVRELDVVELLNLYPDDMDGLFGLQEAIERILEALS